MSDVSFICFCLEVTWEKKDSNVCCTGTLQDNTHTYTNGLWTGEGTVKWHCSTFHSSLLDLQRHSSPPRDCDSHCRSPSVAKLCAFFGCGSVFTFVPTLGVTPKLSPHLCRWKILAHQRSRVCVSENKSSITSVTVFVKARYTQIKGGWRATVGVIHPCVHFVIDSWIQ